MQTATVPSFQPMAYPPRGRRFRATPLHRPMFGRRRNAAPAVEASAVGVVEERGQWIITYKDIRQFLMAYTACFVVVMGMIA